MSIMQLFTYFYAYVSFIFYTAFTYHAHFYSFIKLYEARDLFLQGCVFHIARLLKYFTLSTNEE